MAREPEPPRPEPAAPGKEPKARRPRPKKPAGTPARGKAPATRKVASPPPASLRDQPWRLTGLVAGGILVFDQLTKWIVVHGLDLATRREIDVIDPFLNFRMAWNQGVNFGLFASSTEIMRWVLVAVAVAVCVWVGAWVLRARPGRMAQVAAGLLIGGAIGNVIDRVAYGAVADFLNMSLPNWRNPYSFNVADIAIFAGALGLVFQPQPGQSGDKPRDGARKTR